MLKTVAQPRSSSTATTRTRRHRTRTPHGSRTRTRFTAAFCPRGATRSRPASLVSVSGTMPGPTPRTRSPAADVIPAFWFVCLSPDGVPRIAQKDANLPSFPVQVIGLQDAQKIMRYVGNIYNDGIVVKFTGFFKCWDNLICMYLWNSNNNNNNNHSLKSHLILQNYNSYA